LNNIRNHLIKNDFASNIWFPAFLCVQTKFFTDFTKKRISLWHSKSQRQHQNSHRLWNSNIPQQWKKKGNTMFHIGGCPHTANIKVNKNRIQSKCYPPTVSVLFLNFLKTGSQLRWRLQFPIPGNEELTYCK
jgi:hypothetical protein